MKYVISFLLLACVAAAQTPANKPKPLVMIKGNGDVLSVRGATSQHDQTIEMAKQLLKHCPQVELIVADSELKPDYELVLNRESTGWFNEGYSQIMLLGYEGRVMWTSQKGTVAKAVKAACEQILTDWKGAPKAASGDPAHDWWKPAPK